MFSIIGLPFYGAWLEWLQFVCCTICSERRLISERGTGINRSRDTCWNLQLASAEAKLCVLVCVRVSVFMCICTEMCRQRLIIFRILFWTSLLVSIDFSSPSDSISFVHYRHINVRFSANNSKLHQRKSYFLESCRWIVTWSASLSHNVHWIDWIHRLFASSPSVAAANFLTNGYAFGYTLPFLSNSRQKADKTRQFC